MQSVRRVSTIIVAALVLAGSAAALSDSDADVIPNQDDNCSVVPNGPNQGSNQIDSDGDGYGNACDADYDDSGTTTAIDFGIFLGTFGTASAGETDHDGSGTITTADYATFIRKFSSAPGQPGPSGLACAGSSPCFVFGRRTLNPSGPSIVATAGVPNEVRSAGDYDVIVFELPAGHAWRGFSVDLETGAPGGACSEGAQCLAEGSYRFVGWESLAAAEASPLAGTLFDVDVSPSMGVIEQYGFSNGGDPNAAPFRTSVLSFSIGIADPDLACPTTGCFVALLADVSQAPGLTIQARKSVYPAVHPPGSTANDRRLCPVGCEGGEPVGLVSVYLRAVEH